MQTDFFPVFAEWARKHGLDEARRRFGPVLQEELAAFVAEYEERITRIETDDPPVLHGPRDPWYPGPNDEGDTYWPALRTYFASELGWSDDRVRPVDKASSKVVAYTPRPELEKWTSKGLVVGYVQSGKTTNFTSVIAKAADVGYKLVIVLSGIHNGLRRQTQERLDQQLRELTPTRWLTLTDQVHDFRPPSMQSTALLHNQDGVALCVAKKNKTVLKRLDAWLEDASKQRVLADLPVLVIDDEADQASVETRSINPLIRQILSKLPRCTYIGYTATPFANILIDPAAGDLYPENFILNLPRPDGYFGSERIFGRDLVEGEEANGAELDGFDMVRIIDEDEMESLRPASRRAEAMFEPDITPSMVSATRWFWLATAARRARGDAGHSTMLIHTSVKIAVHEGFKDPLIDLRDDMSTRLRRDDRALIDELESLWDAETARVPASEFPGLPVTPFADVLAMLPEVVGATRVIIDNCRSEDRLDYSAPGQVAIAVGGATLSRGLTLEGLVVSFFVRAAQAYDTLLQMARWFGFRHGYEDLPRIWMTDQLCDWFRHLSTVEHEIRLDIDRYEQQGLTPTEFGVRIRTHPVLRVTAKMGAYKPAYASYGGRRIQTRYFPVSNTEWLQANFGAADALVRSVRGDGGMGERLDSGATLYRDVSADLVERFLGSYRSHADSPDLDRDLVLKYVRKQRQQGALGVWSVAVMAGVDDRHGAVSLGGLPFSRISRAKVKDTGPERADIKTLMSKDHRVVDLHMTSQHARAMNESALMDARNYDPVARDRGLLLIYPIDPRSEPDPRNIKNRSALGAVGDVIGMALVFPGNAEAKTSVGSTYISVDLSEADVEVEEAELASLNGEDEQ